MDAHSNAAAASRAPDPGFLSTARNALTVDEIRVTISQKSGPPVAEIANRDLYATLQLLANRIQYLTGASSATIALREGPELLCEASAGPMATELGASVRVDPGFVNQSIIAEQIFCCNNTRDAVSGDGKRYREHGIKAIMIMPLFRESEVVGVLELLADRTNAFNDSHGQLLEHFAEMIFTALAQAEMTKRIAIKTAVEEELEISAKTPGRQRASVLSADLPSSTAARAVLEAAPAKKVEIAQESISEKDEISRASFGSPSPIAAPEPRLAAASGVMETAHENKIEIPAESISTQAETATAAVESSCPIVPAEAAPAAASAKVQFCEACGFPVSEGRKLCLDCEEGRTGAEPGTAPGFLSQLEREQKQGWLETHFYTIGTIVMALLTMLALVLKFR